MNPDPCTQGVHNGPAYDCVFEGQLLVRKLKPAVAGVAVVSVVIAVAAPNNQRGLMNNNYHYRFSLTVI
jgi:hypothetical protein